MLFAVLAQGGTGTGGLLSGLDAEQALGYMSATLQDPILALPMGAIIGISLAALVWRKLAHAMDR